MDRNNIIGFALIFVVLMVWSYFSTKSNRAQIEKQRVQDSIAQIQFRQDSIKRALMKPDTNAAVMKSLLPQNGFNGDSTNKPQEVSLENDLMKITFNNFGGKITRVELKKYFKMTEQKKGPDLKSPVYLLSNPANEWNVKFTGSTVINTKEILFHINKPEANTIEFLATTPQNNSIRQVYKLLPTEYQLGYKIETTGMSGSAATLEWQNLIAPQEKSANFEKTYATQMYKPVDGDATHIKYGNDDAKQVTGNTKWVSHVQQFFNTTLISEESFKNVKLESTASTNTDQYLVKENTTLDIPIQNNASASMKFILGPNEFDKLRAEGNQLENIVGFGSSILGTINKWVIRPVFNALSHLFSNKGLVIMLLTLIVKLVLFPLSYKMLHSQAKMAALKPELASLKEKYKDDAQQQQMESMKVYREFGVNPLGGCMPMVMQMPIWLALYRFFPASIAFRQSGFLWANDLSSYDVFAKFSFNLPFIGSHLSLFTIIWLVSTLVFTYYSTKDQDFSANPAMKYMQYLMPVVFLVIFNNSASGLTAYMAFSNLLNIAQTLGGKALLFPVHKMRAELNAAKLKPKKKGGFSERLEQMMKEQQSKAEVASRQKQVKK